MSPAVEVVDAVKTYRATGRALDGLSFTANRGEVTALLGPNGAGKTTIVEICEGFRGADGGTVRVLGLDPLRHPALLKPRVGVMLQSGGIPPAARAGEMLHAHAAFHAHPVEPAKLLDRLGLRESARTPYRRLSGGQQQRLSLALALVGRPELVFLDEPTAGLDPQARRNTWDLVHELRADGVAVVVTTHYMEEAERVADHVVIIDNGTAVATGSPESLVATRTGQVLHFRAAPGLDLDSLVSALPPGHVAREERPGRYVVEGEVGPELMAAVTAWCAARHVLATGLQIHDSTLEDVFLELTGREPRT